MSTEQVNEIFNRVTFDEMDRELHKLLYFEMKNIANFMDSNAPDSPDKTLAFRAMHLALMHFGSALTKKEKYKS